MHKLILALLLTFSLHTVSAQTGKIRLTVNVPWTDAKDTSNQWDARLYQAGDKLIYNKKINATTFFTIDNLQPGNYYLKLYKAQVLMLTLHTIEVKPNEVLELSIPYDVFGYRPDTEKENKTATTHTETDIHPFDYALLVETYQPFLQGTKNALLQNTYTLAYQLNMVHYPTKKYGIGMIIKTSYGASKLQRGQLNIFQGDFKKERYSFCKYSIGLLNRIVLKKSPNSKAFPWCLDLSAMYNIPLWYSYDAIDGNKHLSIRGIGRFNDVTAVARLNFGAIGVHATYRFFNNIKPSFPQEARLLLGIDMIGFLRE
jgi:hypothetical protein